MSVLNFIDQYLEHYQPYKTNWCYEDGCVLLGSQKLYEATKISKYRDFVLSFLDSRVLESGEIVKYEKEQYNIDSVNCSKALFFALEQTKEPRYRKAIEFQMQKLMEHPRCECGNFWHKTIYPYQVWLDGLYMAQPFYAQYERDFGGEQRLSDIISQYQNVRKYLFDEKKGLYYHAWDEKREQPWCDKQTGLSHNFWLRAIGWHIMSMIDVIALIPQQLYEHYRAMEDLFREAIRGVMPYQDKATGLFYQVVDHPENAQNYTETSGSSMIAYALLKGCRLKVLDREKYLDKGRQMMDSLIKNELTGADGEQHLKDICSVAGLGPGEKRDGSVAYYLSEKIVCDDAKGVGPFIMAYAEALISNQQEG